MIKYLADGITDLQHFHLQHIEILFFFAINFAYG